jgi:hypothetical protein
VRIWPGVLRQHNSPNSARRASTCTARAGAVTATRATATRDGHRASSRATECISRAPRSQLEQLNKFAPVTVQYCKSSIIVTVSLQCTFVQQQSNAVNVDVCSELTRLMHEMHGLISAHGSSARTITFSNQIKSRNEFKTERGSRSLRKSPALK